MAFTNIQHQINCQIKNFFLTKPDGFRLACSLHLPEEESSSLVIISHGFAANKDRKRLVKLAEALCQNRIAALRFDFGGCGQSDDRAISLRSQVDDLSFLINHFSKKYKKIGLFGESLGGLTSLLAYSPAVKFL